MNALSTEINIYSGNRFAEAKFTTWVGFWINLLLSILKIGAGYLGRSSAMVADGVHSISDSVTDFMVIVGFHFANRPQDDTHDYGHGKFETLTSALIGLILLGVGIGIFWSGMGRVLSSINGNILPTPGWLAFGAAIISILVNELLYRYQWVIGKKISSQAIMANAWHHKSDALTSVATLIGIGGAILLGPKWVILDPIAAILVSGLIVKVSLAILIEGIRELTEASLGKELKNKILRIAHSIPGVKNPHDLRTRKIGNYVGIDLHIEVDKSLNIIQAHAISDQLENALQQSFGKQSLINVHVDPANTTEEKNRGPKKESRIFLFLDLKSSTRIAESLGNEKYHQILKAIYSDITDPVLKSRGEIYQYAGDQVIISWELGTGKKKDECIRCFFDIRDTILSKKTKYLELFGLVPEFKAGLHYGVVVSGEIGILKREMTFSGDVLNTTARIQQLCNHYQANLICSKQVVDHIYMQSDYALKRLGPVKLKGKRKVMELFEIKQ